MSIDRKIDINLRFQLIASQLTTLKLYNDRFFKCIHKTLNQNPNETNGSRECSRSEQRLRKAVSDVSSEIDRYTVLETTSSTIDEVMQAECECCGIREECTQNYIAKIKGSHSGEWVCGLCCEAVKERLMRAPKMAVHEAVSSHRDFCQNFNTNRLNPNLSLTSAMRDIAKRSCENRNSKNLSKLGRSTSCVPKFDRH
ncbi:hypothetical protein ACOSQ4_008509 [Xanthoceras sorbifolium]